MERNTPDNVNPPFQLQGTAFQSSFPSPMRSPMPSAFKLDEGYSEETRSQAEMEAFQSTRELLEHQDWIMGHSEADRAEFAYNVLRSLRTATISDVVERLTPLLHMDPVQKLPPEITSEIFAYLEPSTLLTASLASRSWRERILDSRLWRQLYTVEGWGLDLGEIRSFERQQSDNARPENRKSRMRSSDNDVGQPQHKKRVTSSWFGPHRRRSSATDSGAQSSKPPSRWEKQHGCVEADRGSPSGSEEHTADAEGDHEMQDAAILIPPFVDAETRQPASTIQRSHMSNSRQSSCRDSDEMQLSPRPAQRGSLLGQPFQIALYPPLTPSIILQPTPGAAKVNWPYLYKQRRRLEDNWTQGRFSTFQLPQPSYPHEAHRECVYTIQFSGKWLVSGSRDKTLRIWDLETKRLRGPPLTGHTQSVLCLQFDPSEKEDIIISGSSDTNVIIWRFSTGQKIQEIPHAHRESVLNLRFDERFLVTCSKDKLIKIWNRHELVATDEDYPSFNKTDGVKFPSYIVDTNVIPSAVLESRIANRQIKTLLPYTLLMTLEGHGAAVNAIQIDKDEIVSASGDRLIKIWNVHNGTCLKTLVGHLKGIACVQFDSRRIVSGSSDNTVRIYDHNTGAEVACLQGHSNLVRTVQAGFGDLPVTDEDLRLEAEAVDKAYWEARRSGALPASVVSAHRRTSAGRNAGSRNPKDIMALGAKIPPGGGGSNWGRIVSGSYDETIIIWKKDREGKWVISQRLRQEDAARAIEGLDPRAALHHAPTATAHGNIVQHITGTAAPLLHQQQPGPAGHATQFPLSAPQIMQHAVQTSMAGLQAGVQNVMNIGNVLRQQQTSQNNSPNNTNNNTDNDQNAPTTGPQPSHQSQQQTHWMGPGAQQVMHQLHNHAQNMAQQVAHATQAGAATNIHNIHAQPQPQPQPHHGGHPYPNPHHAPQPASRVFKLQFDARRIVCCSQDPKIVGWDFAAGDEDIEGACRFFVGP